MTQVLLTAWIKDDTPARPRRPECPPRPRRVLCLGGDGLATRPWTRSGFSTIRSADLAHGPNDFEQVAKRHVGNVVVSFAFPSASDLSTAGARWWKKKRALNPNFQDDSVKKLKLLEKFLKAVGAPYCIFVPSSPTVHKKWRRPNAKISPYHYGGYLDENDAHPQHGEVIPKRDAYDAKTSLYTGNGFVVPRRKPVSPVYEERFCKRRKKKVRISPLLAKRKHAHLRRLTPRGFVEAVARLHPGAAEGP